MVSKLTLWGRQCAASLISLAALVGMASVGVTPTLGPWAIAAAVDSAAPQPLPLRPLAAVASDPVWADLTLPADRQALIQAIDHSLSYLATPKAAADYRAHPVPGITRDRVWRSLQRLRHLVATSPSDRAFQTALRRDFVIYEAIGTDGEGTVAFTGYFEPLYRASPIPTSEYRYPLYRRPPTLDSWPLPHPTRLALEGADGLAGSQGALAGLELVWLANRLEAFLVQVQGSAKLQLPDGRVMSVGYAGRTDYPYTSIGRALVNDGKIAPDQLSLPNLLAYFEAHPAELDRYLPQNERFIFFREGGDGPPNGSLGVPVTAGHSIATDKSLMPPGAIAIIQVPLPQPPEAITQQRCDSDSCGWSHQTTTRLVLDQDTGGAIIGPGRVDLFVGSGPQAGDLAGRINTPGRLYYLLLR
jgi:membrane-bound lytic murein transglycosylase A